MNGSFLERQKIRLQDKLRSATWIHFLDGCRLLCQGFLSRDLSRRLNAWASAYRRLLPLGAHHRVEHLLKPYVEDPSQRSLWRSRRIGWERFEGKWNTERINKGLILKTPSDTGEKGVLLCSFDYSWLPVLANPRFEEISSRYTLIASTPWSPPHFQTLWSMGDWAGGDVYSFISHSRDMEWMTALDSGVTPIPFLMSHWIRQEDYYPKAFSSRTIDLLMVANWADFKRHWLLFEALAQLPREWKIVLVGQDEAGRTQKDLMRQADAFGVRERLDIRTSLTIQEVNQLQCDARLSLVFSRREGSCVVVAESLFAGAAVGLIQGAHIGSGEFITPETGMWLDEAHLSRDLRRLMEKAPSLRPRQWAIEHIEATDSLHSLNQILRDSALKRGQTWTRDIVPFSWKPNPTYKDASTRAAMEPCVRAFKDAYGLQFPT